MEKEAGVPLMITISKECRDKLRTIAAKKNLKNLNEVTTASQVGREIICDFLSTSESKKGGSNDGKQPHNTV